MKKKLTAALILAMVIGAAAPVSAAAETDGFHVEAPEDPGKDNALDAEHLKEARQEAWEQYREEALADTVLTETTALRGDPSYQFEAEIVIR